MPMRQLLRLSLACAFYMSVFPSAVSLAIGGRKRFLWHLRVLQQSHLSHNYYCIRDTSSSSSSSSSISSSSSSSNNHKNNHNRCKKVPPTATATALSFSSASSEDGNNNEESSSGLGSTKKNHPTTVTTTKVVVIGAGISGLSVAYHLKKLSESLPLSKNSRVGNNNNNINININISNSPRFDIEILEVRNRIGGRIRPFNINIDGDGDSERDGDGQNERQNENCNDGETPTPTWIDLGGQWLHESSPQNPIRRLLEDDLNLGFVGGDDNDNDDDNDNGGGGGKKKKAKKKSNRFHEKRVKNVLFDQDGTIMDKGIVQRARNVFYKAMGDGDDLDDDYPVDDDDRGTDRNSISFRDLLDVRTEIELRSDQRLMGSVTASASTSASTSTSPDVASSSLQLQSFDRAMNYFVHRSEENEGGKLHEVSAFLANNLYEGGGDSPDRVVQGSYRSLLEALSSQLGLKRNEDADADADRNDGDDIDITGTTTTTTSTTTNTNNDEGKHCRVRLRSNARVERIEYGGDERISLSIVENEMSPADANGSGKDNDNENHHPASASASTATTSVLDCDYCVCTVPLGVLQQRKIEFVPPLPQKRQEAIDGIGMGLLNKIVFRFDFENTNHNSKDSNNANANANNRNEDSYKFWGNLKQFGICHEDPALIKTYYDCTDDYYGEDQGTKSFTSAILIQFLAGSSADRVDPPLPPIAEMDINNNENNNNYRSVASGGGLTDEEAIHESLQALRSVFGSENVPKPSVSKVTRWRNDPWSCGSYSFTKVGSSPGMYDEIASPLGSSNDRLLFAGEHTSKHCHSTVHGAWETGVREAERIFERVQHQHDR